MTAQRFFRDPKGGIPYAFGEKWPSADATESGSALRKMEKALYRSVVQNWFGPISFDSVTIPTSTCLAFDATLGLWAFAYRVAGNLNVFLKDTSFNSNSPLSSTVPATTANAISAASSDQGCIVFGLGPPGSTAAKILQTNDGVTWSLRTIGSASTKSITFVRWSGSASRFIALATTGEAYTSPDGVTWSQRTVPGGLTGATWTGLAVSNTGVAVATANGTTSYMTSADGGVTWVQRTGPTNGANVAYAPGAGAGLQPSGAFAWGTTHVSGDGISWSAMIAPPAGAAVGVTQVFGMGPMFIAITTQIGGTGGGARVEISYDQANPSVWSLVSGFSPPDGFDGSGEYIYASENQIALVAAQSANAVFYRSHSLGY